MAYAGKCDRCGGFYDIPFEHGAPIRARMIDVFDGVTDSKTEAICDGDIIWDDLIQTLKEETGLDFTIRENK